MKKLFVLFSLIPTVALSKGCPYLRAILLNPNVYRTKVDLKLTQFAETDGKLLAAPTEITLKPATGQSIRYKIVGSDGDYTIIRLLPRMKLAAGNSALVSEDKPEEKDDATRYVYCIKTKDFGLNQKILMSEKIVGTPLVFPFKLRLQDKGDGAVISTDFTIGYTFGLRLKTSKIPYKANFFTIIPYGFGLGSTKYFYQKSDGTYSDKKDGVAVTYYTGGFLWTISKVNFGVFAGVDAMLDKQNNWAYQGKWWYSFGLGYKFKAD